MWENGKLVTMPPQATENHFYPSDLVYLLVSVSTSYWMMGYTKRMSSYFIKTPQNPMKTPPKALGPTDEVNLHL